MTEAFLFHIILRTGLKKWELILELKINCTWNSQGDTDQTTTLLILRRFSELTVLLCPLPLPIHPWSSPLKALALEVVLVVKNPPANTGDATDAGSIPGLGRYPGKRKWQLLQYSCQEELMDRGTWEATVKGVTKSRTWLNVLAHTSCLSGNCELVSGHESTLFLGCWPPKWSNFSFLTLISQVMAFERWAAGPGFSSSIAQGTILNIL